MAAVGVNYSFRPNKEVPTHDLKRAIIANSQTSFQIGWALQTGAASGAHTKYVIGAANSNPILGIALAIEGKNGQVLEKATVTTASDNETVGMIQSVFIPSNIPVEYTVVMDDPAETTAGSGGFGFMNLMSSDPTQLDESTWVIYSGTAAQFWSNGVTGVISTLAGGSTGYKPFVTCHVYKVL